MLERVGQSLLHDPVGGQIDSRCEGGGLTLDEEANRQPRLPYLLDQVVQLSEARLRCQLRLALGVAEQAEQPAQLHQRLAAGGLDRAEQVARGPFLAVEHALDCLRLDDHDAHAVGDHVVELACDACALLGGRGPRLFLALLFEPAGAVAEQRDLAPVPPHLAPDQEREHERQPCPRARAVCLEDARRDVDPRERRKHRASADEPAPIRAVRADRVEADEEGEPGSQRRPVRGGREQRACNDRCADRGDDGDRSAPPPHERERDQCDDHADRGATAVHRQARGRMAPDLPLDLGQERECEHQVAPTLRALAEAHLAKVLGDGCSYIARGDDRCPPRIARSGYAKALPGRRRCRALVLASSRNLEQRRHGVHATVREARRSLRDHLPGRAVPHGGQRLAVLGDRTWRDRDLLRLPRLPLQRARES